MNGLHDHEARRWPTSRFSAPLTLGGFLREVCRRNRDKEALVFHPPGGKPVVRFTYAQVWHEAFAVARALVARGVAKETRVGLLATNRPEWVIAMFGIALAGGTCVALSTFAKTRSSSYMLRMGDVSLLIFERSVLEPRLRRRSCCELCPELATSKGPTCIDATAVPARCGLHRRCTAAARRVRIVE